MATHPSRRLDRISFYSLGEYPCSTVPPVYRDMERIFARLSTPGPRSPAGERARWTGGVSSSRRAPMRGLRSVRGSVAAGFAVLAMLGALASVSIDGWPDGSVPGTTSLARRVAPQAATAPGASSRPLIAVVQPSEGDASSHASIVAPALGSHSAPSDRRRRRSGQPARPPHSAETAHTVVGQSRSPEPNRGGAAAYGGCAGAGAGAGREGYAQAERRGARRGASRCGRQDCPAGPARRALRLALAAAGCAACLSPGDACITRPRSGACRADVVPPLPFR